MMQQMTMQTEKESGRRILLLIAALFLIPILLVLGLYYFEWRPSVSSHGELVTPPLPLQLTELHDLQGRPFPAARWKEKWNLVYIDSTGCDAACRTQVHMLRQIHVSLNKEIGRVRRLLLVPADRPSPTLTALQQQYPDLIILAGRDVAALARQFDLPGQPAAVAGEVYLVDPLGNLMMRYPGDYEPAGLRHDMGRLLKYSWVG